MPESLDQIAARLAAQAEAMRLSTPWMIVSLIADALRAAQATGSAETLEQLAIARARLDTMTRERDNWTETAAFHLRNEEFYRGLIHQTGNLLGPDVYVSDDGSVQESVLALKVPELVKKLVEGRAETEARIVELEAERDEARMAATKLLTALGMAKDELAVAQGSAEGRAALDRWIQRFQAWCDTDEGNAIEMICEVLDEMREMRAAVPSPPAVEPEP